MTFWKIRRFWRMSFWGNVWFENLIFKKWHSSKSFDFWKQLKKELQVRLKFAAWDLNSKNISYFCPYFVMSRFKCWHDMFLRNLFNYGNFAQNQYWSVLKGKLLSDTIKSVLGSTELLNFQENLSTVAYKGVAYKKTRKAKEVWRMLQVIYTDV